MPLPPGGGPNYEKTGREPDSPFPPLLPKPSANRLSWPFSGPVDVPPRRPGSKRVRASAYRSPFLFRMQAPSSAPPAWFFLGPPKLEKLWEIRYKLGHHPPREAVFEAPGWGSFPPISRQETLTPLEATRKYLPTGSPPMRAYGYSRTIYPNKIKEIFLLCFGHSCLAPGGSHFLLRISPETACWTEPCELSRPWKIWPQSYRQDSTFALAPFATSPWSSLHISWQIRCTRFSPAPRVRPPETFFAGYPESPHAVAPTTFHPIGGCSISFSAATGDTPIRSLT
jgi:hypothetical protein